MCIPTAVCFTVTCLVTFLAIIAVINTLLRMYDSLLNICASHLHIISDNLPNSLFLVNPSVLNPTQNHSSQSLASQKSWQLVSSFLFSLQCSHCISLLASRNLLQAPALPQTFYHLSSIRLARVIGTLQSCFPWRGCGRRARSWGYSKTSV